jgi:hypothetical protein
MSKPNKTQELDLNKLTKALDNTNNDSIMNLTTRKLMELNLKILKELMFDKETLINYLRKLKGYKYIDEIDELKHGAFIKWIPITDPKNLPLNQCGLICDIKITDDGVIIVCKNFMHRHYTFKTDEVLIFQKLSNQEMVIISALDHLENEEKEKKQVKKQVKTNTKANTNSKKDQDKDDDESDVSEVESDYEDDSEED